MVVRPKSKKVTERQQKLARALTVSENLSHGEKAEALLGYRSGEIAAITASPAVARAVKAGLVRRLVAEAAPLSIGLLIKVVKQGHAAADRGEAPTNTHTDAAKALIGFAGIQAVAEEKDIGELTDLELKQMLEQFKAEDAKRSAIDAPGTVSAPDSAPVEGQAVENVDSLFS